MMSNDEWTLDGKVAIVTGASSGIGLETVKMLLESGCTVVMACRDVEKAESCRQNILEEAMTTKRKAAVEVEAADWNPERCYVLKLDLSSFRSIRQFADEIDKRFKKVHILVNNAGIFHSQRIQTEDDVEIHFGVNHLGHFLLTRLLMGKLISSSPSRVVNVSSKAHEYSRLDFQDLQTRTNWYPMRAYARSKTANVLFTAHLALLLRGTGVTAYCLHPGVVDTSFGRHLEGSWFMRFFRLFMFLSRKKMLDPRSGAATTYYCCSEGSLSSQNGLYYSECKKKQPKKYATSPAGAEMLWNVSSAMCGLPPNMLPL